MVPIFDILSITHNQKEVFRRFDKRKCGLTVKFAIVR